jgi:hypothetical protein
MATRKGVVSTFKNNFRRLVSEVSFHDFRLLIIDY